jgi:hypothetical protein
MKRNRIVLALGVTAALLLAVSGCAKTGTPYSKDALMEKLSGEWKNTEYDRSTSPARRIIDIQGNFTQYDKTYKEENERTGEFTITKAWVESEGVVWFKDKVRYRDSGATVYEL